MVHFMHLDKNLDLPSSSVRHTQDALTFWNTASQNMD